MEVLNVFWIRNLLFIYCFLEVLSSRCDRRPYGSTTLASAPDGRFQLSVEGTENTYIPEQLYIVKIAATDDESQFTSFIITAEGEQKADPRSPRRTISQSPGELRPQSSVTSKYSDRCLYSVEQATNNLKSSVEVYWVAPTSGNGCVTLRAMVAESELVWYEDGGPLSIKICEDTKQPDDVSPILNENCKICDEAKYEVSFTGVWSRNTHPKNYPENDWTPSYSDFVGASHVLEHIIWAPGMLASPGLKHLAEYANSSMLEDEILKQVGSGTRTLIKGKGHGHPKMKNPSIAFFRVDKKHHLITTAVAIHPSPDWFLGVTRFELCQSDNTWLQQRELNLYPWDAGTDSGVSYESVNVETFPQDAIGRVDMSSYDKNSPFFETDMKDMHPFGKLNIRLVRTYHRTCEEESGENNTETPGTGGDTETEMEPETPSRYQNPDLATGDHVRESPIIVNTESPEDPCPMTEWDEWSACDGPCVNGKISGYKWRARYHLVNGIPVDKYETNVKMSSKKLQDSCKEQKSSFESKSCSVPCGDDAVTASRRLNAPVLPGHPWNTKKRNVPIRN